MKRKGNLFELIWDRENLRIAFYKASKGKRDREDVRDFAGKLESNLLMLARLIQDNDLQLGRTTQFVIHDPKKRIITAPCFLERVLHHAIMNVCEPYFERSMIPDTFACRKGKGRVACMRRMIEFSGRYKKVILLDMRKYFDSISHSILLCKLQRIFKDTRLLTLFEQILDSHHHEPGRGLPIGSLTSQYFANFFLSSFDHYVKRTLRVPGYVRYMDDCVMWGETPLQMKDLERASHAYLSEHLDLQAKPIERIYSCKQGFPAIGCRIFQDHIQLTVNNKKRFRRKMRQLFWAYEAGELSAREFQERSTAITAFTNAGGTKSWRFRSTLLKQMEVDHRRARTGSTVAAVGTTRLRILGRRTATGTTRRTGTTTSVFGSAAPQLDGFPIDGTDDFPS